LSPPNRPLRYSDFFATRCAPQLLHRILFVPFGVGLPLRVLRLPQAGHSPAHAFGLPRFPLMEYTRPQPRHERCRLPWRLRPLERVSELPQLGQFIPSRQVQFGAAPTWSADHWRVFLRSGRGGPPLLESQVSGLGSLQPCHHFDIQSLL